MITIDKTHKHARLDKRVLILDNYDITWMQYVHLDSSLVNIGSFVYQKRTSHGWAETLRKKIIKKSLSKNK